MVLILLLPLAFAALFLAVESEGWRDRFLRAAVMFGAAAWAMVELLSLAGAVTRLSLAAAWALVTIAAFLRRRPVTLPRLKPDPVVIVCLAGCVTVAVFTGLVALLSPPNSTDAMAYHLPRVVYWAEQSSVGFFPTPFLNQIMLQPMAEYLMLHAYLLAGGDWFVNLVQWSASLGAIAGVSLVARELGAGGRGQALAALVSATLPAGILASSGAKNDLVCALWLVAAIYFASRTGAARWKWDAVCLGCAIGLALDTKATAYLFTPALVAVAWWAGARAGARAMPRVWRNMRDWRPPHVLVCPAIALACALSIDAPLFVRNYRLSGWPLGFDSAYGDGAFRWRNDKLGWKPLVSGALRNLSEQLGARSQRWNQGVYGFVVAVHKKLHIDWNDPATTWPWAEFAPPLNANHEANAPNRWQLLLLAVAVLAAIRRRNAAWLWYTAALAFGFLAFCEYLKWQPFLARLFLPLLVASAPLMGAAFGRWRAPVSILLALFLLNNARPALFENWVRPWSGPASVLHANRDQEYFADMGSWNNAPSFFGAVSLLDRSRCGVVGIDISNLTLEYPLQALLRERNPAVRFLHTGVSNLTRRYAPPVPDVPCAVVCLDCAGDAKRLSLYQGFPRSTMIGRFVVFQR
ncbi:MAG: hypothetical protein ACLPY2_05060 [Bryobacteraceae bacterium]|jgi:hypothetical protein